jgi:hypothetical protein
MYLPYYYGIKVDVVVVEGHTVVVVDVVVSQVLLPGIVPKAAVRMLLTVVAAPEPCSTAMITVLSSMM